MGDIVMCLSIFLHLDDDTLGVMTCKNISRSMGESGAKYNSHAKAC